MRSALRRALPAAGLVGAGLAIATLRDPVGAANAAVNRRRLEVRADLAYGPHRRHRLDLYRPRGAQGPLPTVVFVHGGHWHGGDKSAYAFLAEPLAAAGLATAVLNYRLAPETVFPGFVRDVASAVAWLLERSSALGVVPAGLHLMGQSSGAHVAALAAMDARYLAERGLARSSLRSFVGLAGAYDFLRYAPHHARTIAALGPEAGWPETQPILYADAGAPTTLLVHGLRDRVVSPGNSIRLARRLREAGARVELKLYAHVDHAGSVGALAKVGRVLGPRVLPDLLDFLARA